MAQALNLLRGSIVLLAAMLAVVPAFAEDLDPTRPPPGIAKTEAADATNDVQTSAGLQQIIRRAGMKPAAVINGQRVELGGRVGDARLTEVGEDFAVLRGLSGQETLYLTPGIRKKTAKAASQGGGKAKP